MNHCTCVSCTSVEGINEQLRAQLKEAREVIGMLENFKAWTIKPVAVNPERLFSETSVFIAAREHQKKWGKE